MLRERPRRAARHVVARAARALFVLAGVALLAVSAAGCETSSGGQAVSSPAASGDAALARAFQDHASGVDVEGAGMVERLLSDDLKGGRHQRFILEMPSGQTVLVAHNIDIAPRIDGLAVGDEVAFRGIYEWNAQGGVVHWTHHDPSGEHPAGWLRLGGQTVQ
jgi:hypothetical protein